MVDVSIWITTYNHEMFIAEAIESVLRQQTNLSYEIIIGEDCSTDRTREIVISYKEKYPDKIVLYLPEQNIGMISMTKASYNICTGRYVAWLDGDDYWNDPLKLQKQINFLEENPEFSFCFHKVALINEIDNWSAESIDPLYKDVDDSLLIKHFLQKYNPVYALSVVHRNVAASTLPNWLFSLPFPDWGFYLVLCKYGKAKYFKESMGVYRIHKGGAYSGQNAYNNLLQITRFFELVKKIENGIYKKYADKVLRCYNFKLLKIDLKKGDFYMVMKRIYYSFNMR